MYNTYLDMQSINVCTYFVVNNFGFAIYVWFYCSRTNIYIYKIDLVFLLLLVILTFYSV